jgi:hypothetical protein
MMHSFLLITVTDHSCLLQLIAFLHAVYTTTPLRRLLVLVPVNCMENWGVECHRWLHAENRLPVYSTLVVRTPAQRAAYLRKWHELVRGWRAETDSLTVTGLGTGRGDADEPRDVPTAAVVVAHAGDRRGLLALSAGAGARHSGTLSSPAACCDCDLSLLRMDILGVHCYSLYLSR